MPRYEQWTYACIFEVILLIIAILKYIYVVGLSTSILASWQISGILCILKAEGIAVSMIHRDIFQMQLDIFSGSLVSVVCL